MGETIIYLDLDGCFADLAKMVKDVYGADLSEFDKVKWSVLKSVPNLFFKLEPIPGSIDAFKQIMSLGYDTQMLTALPKPTMLLASAPEDKVAWVRKHLHPTIQVNCAANWRHKICWVGRKHILIDDTQRNIAHWNEHGGKGIHHNGDWSDTIKRLESVL